MEKGSSKKARECQARLSHQKINIEARKCNAETRQYQFLFMKRTLDDVLLSSRQFTARIKIDCEHKKSCNGKGNEKSALVSA